MVDKRTPVKPATYDPLLPAIQTGDGDIFQVLNDEGTGWDEPATAAAYLAFLKEQEGSTPATGADAAHLSALADYVEANTPSPAPEPEPVAEPAPEPEAAPVSEPAAEPSPAPAEAHDDTAPVAREDAQPASADAAPEHDAPVADPAPSDTAEVAPEASPADHDGAAQQG